MTDPNDSTDSADMGLSASWSETTWVAFDTETTGAYPVGSEICELAAVKWQNGQIVDTFQSLLRPKKLMSDFIIGIHGITNEMVQSAPKFSDVGPQFLQFIEGSTLIAHHAQFDLGFLAEQLEQSALDLPEEPVLCSSLLAQAVVEGVANHKLQTLASHYRIDPGTAHRALDDARTCLEVSLQIFNEMTRKSLDQPLTPNELGRKMKSRSDREMQLLHFKEFSILALEANPKLTQFFAACREQRAASLVYRGGSRPGQARLVQPLGVIRQVDGDSFVARDLTQMSTQPKKFWVKDIEQVTLAD